MEKENKRQIDLTDKVPKKEKYHIKTIFLSILIGFLFILPLSIVAYSVITSNDPIQVAKVNVLGAGVTLPVFETYTYGFSENLPEQMKELISEGLDDVALGEIKRYKFVESEPQLLFTMDGSGQNDSIILTSKLVLVGHPYWIKDSFTKDELVKWNFLTTKEDQSVVKLLLDSNFGEGLKVSVVETTEEMISQLADSVDTVGLIRPENIDPHLKLLFYEGGYYLEDTNSGFLSVKLTTVSSDSFPEFLLSTIPGHIDIQTTPVAEDPTQEDIFSLRMTGVTALSRNLAIKIERSGDFAYPAKKIGDFLSQADITHTSNEVSFVDGCIPEQSLRFCSSTKYIETLKSSGIDIVELTGNHNNDFGSDKNANSIQLYKELGWDYFGGGLNTEDASQIRYIERDGTKIAFIGYNWYDTILNTGAIAGESRPGANSYSKEKVVADIVKAKKEADFVIVDFQFQECYSYPETDVIYPICYKPLASPNQKDVFRHAIDSGADLVVGTQAHQPQSFELYKDKFIFYGLGNLYFDQISWIGTRQGLILTHYFIDGEHVQTRVDSTIYDGDMIPYLTYGDQRELLFKLLDDARP